MRKQVGVQLFALMNKVDTTLLTGAMRVWIYIHMIVPKITCDLSLYDFSMSSEIIPWERKVNKYVRRWLLLNKSFCGPLLYLSTADMCLQLPQLSTVFKKARANRRMIVGSSKDWELRVLARQA
jgi:hypothetical protein